MPPCLFFHHVSSLFVRVYTYKVHPNVLQLDVNIKLDEVHRGLIQKNTSCPRSRNNWIHMLGLHNDDDNNNLNLCSTFCCPKWCGITERKRVDL